MEQYRRPLESLNGEELSAVMDEFGRKCYLFQSEAQFQFELAWRLRELYDCRVELEKLTVVVGSRTARRKEKKKKIYSDIFLQNGSRRVVIELKYKTAALEHDNVLLFNHGAVDLGRYDYLWDVHRVEMLVNPERKLLSEKTILGEYGISAQYDIREHCDTGFAVMLTNEDDYWKTAPAEKDSIDRDFCFGAQEPSGQGQLQTSCLDWRRDRQGNYPKAISGSSRARKIELLEQYRYRWKPYCAVIPDNGKNGKFEYLIFEVIS